MTHYLRYKHRRWVARADIDDFFDSLCLDRLRARLREAVGDERVLHLVTLFLEMGAVDRRGQWQDVDAGIGQGNVISPLLANFYLHPFDAHLTERGIGLVRYADDFAILCRKRRAAKRAVTQATQFLKDKLGLRLNGQPRAVDAIEDGFAFLGVRFERHERRLSARKRAKMEARLRQWTTPPQSDDFGKARKRLNEAVTGWRRYYGAVLDDSALDAMSAVLRSAWVQLTARAFERSAFPRVKDAKAALMKAEGLRERSGATQTAWIDGIIGEARTSGAASNGEKTSEKTSRKRASKAVRRKKRDHLRAQTGEAELVVLTPGSFIGKRREAVIVRQQRKIVSRTAVSRLRSITVAAKGVTLSSDVVALCAKRDVPLLFVAWPERPAALLTAPGNAKPALGVCQSRAVAEGAPALALAKAFARGKIRNQRNLMKYVGKYAGRKDPAFAERLAIYAGAVDERLDALDDISCDGGLNHAREQIMGMEGAAAKGYWALVGAALAGRADFAGRATRGATDLVNNMLNYGYALLRSRVHLALLRAGLTPEIGFLHAAYKGRPALVFDLMEEFRPYAVDRTVLTLLRRRQHAELNGEHRLTKATCRQLVTAVHERLATPVTYRSRRLALQAVIQQQARSLAAHLRGEGAYRPWIGRW